MQDPWHGASGESFFCSAFFLENTGSLLQTGSAACPAQDLACPNPSTSNENSGQQKAIAPRSPLLPSPCFYQQLPVQFQRAAPRKSKRKKFTLSHPNQSLPKPPSIPHACDHSRLPWTAPSAHLSPKLEKRIKTLQHDVNKRIRYYFVLARKCQRSLPDVSHIHTDKNPNKFSFTGLKLHNS